MAEEQGGGSDGGNTLRCLNPVTHDITYVPAPNSHVPSLKQTATACVRKALTLNRIHRVCSLELPAELAQSMQTICFNDFWINPDEVTGTHYDERSFPATCLIDNSQVVIELCQPGTEVSSDPAYITRFECSGMLCQVYDVTQSLRDLIQAAKAYDPPQFFPERFIWSCIHKIAEAAKAIPHSNRLDSTVFHIRGDTMFYRETRSEASGQTQVMNSSTTATYESPQVLMRQPASEGCHCWAIGCLAYEMAALDPAYYDREGSGNMMSVMMGVIQGSQPPPLTHQYSEQLKNFIVSCLNIDPMKRPLLDEIIEIAYN